MSAGKLVDLQVELGVLRATHRVHCGWTCAERNELPDSLRGSSWSLQRRLAWPLRKDDTHKSRSVPSFLLNSFEANRPSDVVLPVLRH